ncbi:hypothetical protein [Fusibacter sp. 3D3]|uniref:hypothetical protein n=1 Tax=Fusibacter sp. 3D3 TaxID=1048380 RepID=UPI0008532F7B|nr:hypothetical protein [Fusibacter sp. 3D3]
MGKKMYALFFRAAIVSLGVNIILFFMITGRHYIFFSLSNLLLYLALFLIYSIVFIIEYKLKKEN